MIWSRETLKVVYLPVNNCSSAEREGNSSSHCYGWWKLDLVKQFKGHKIMVVVQSYFNVVGSARHSRCEVLLYPWWDQGGFIYYELLKPNITSLRELYLTHLMRLSCVLREKWPRYKQRHEKEVLQHDNARPHIAQSVKTYLESLKLETQSMPYSPNIALSEFYLFRSMAHDLANQQFHLYEYISKLLDWLIVSKDEQFYCNGIQPSPER